MEQADINGRGNEGPFPMAELVTYKRRKRDRASSSAVQRDTKTVHPASLSNRVYTFDQKSRIVLHWRNVLERLMQSTEAKNDSAIQSCIQKALACNPFGFSDNSTDVDQCAKELYQVTIDRQQNQAVGRADPHSISSKCQSIFFDVFISHKFALLCDLLCENFQGCDAKVTDNLSWVISKMKKSNHKQSFELVVQNLQLVWENYQKIGEEMVLLASSLSNSLRGPYQKQLGVKGEMNSTDSLAASQFTCYESEWLTKHDQTDVSSMWLAKPEQADASYLLRMSTCKQCGTETDGKVSLICDRCESVYHITCIRPTVQEVPKSWFCSSCSNERESAEPDLTNDHQNFLQLSCVECNRLEISEPHCVVCKRLENLGTQEHRDNNLGPNMPVRSKEFSLSCYDHDEQEPSRTALLRLCKQCGTCEDEDKRFLICSHRQCLYKFYHIRCLKSSQLAKPHKKPDCWYCPSCLCRACLTDKDDDLICICDGCDEAYHTYCMKPPRTTVPGGMWYCFKCNLERARKGMKRYEQSILEKHNKNDIKPASGNKQSMDILLSAAEKLRTEEVVLKTIMTNR